MQRETEEKLPTVAAYFAEKLGEALPCDEEDDGSQEWSPKHPDFTIGTGCGEDCKAAIDAAAALMQHVRKAYGSDRPELLADIAGVTAEVVQCFVFG